MDFFDAWGGALSYAFQLYIDFSVYSDRAIDLSRLFSIQLTLNFDSPYEATSISDFWRRWHMTLSRFLRDYLYIPLGGNGHGPWRRYANLGIAFVAVVVAWVFFRSPDGATAGRVLQGTAGINGVVLPMAYSAALEPLASMLEGIGVQVKLHGGAQFVAMYLWVIALAGIAFLLPNTQEIVRERAPALDYTAAYTGRIRLSPTSRRALFVALIAAFGVLSLARQSEFLYFQF